MHTYIYEDEYEDLEDVDEFEDRPHHDPVYDEFTYQYLGHRKGVELTFRGDRYICKNGVVYKDGQEFAKYRDEVPWNDQAFVWNGPPDSPIWKLSWGEVLHELAHIFVGNNNGGGPPPGVPVYEDDEYEGLEDVDEFEELSNPVWMTIIATEEGMTADDLINGAGEILARRGYEVTSDFQTTDSGTNPLWIAGFMELPDYPVTRNRHFDGYGVEVYIGSPSPM